MNDKTALLSSGDGAGTAEEGKGKPDDKLSWTIKIIYGMGGWPHGLTDTVINFYWTPYLLEVCGISPIKASSIILAGRVFDAFTDPLVGFLITKIKPTGSTENGLVAYFMAMFLLYNLCLTCYY
eukprot:gene19715-21404_t